MTCSLGSVPDRSPPSKQTSFSRQCGGSKHEARATRLTAALGIAGRSYSLEGYSPEHRNVIEKNFMAPAVDDPVARRCSFHRTAARVRTNLASGTNLDALPDVIRRA
jgi:hypothetical protein